MTDKVAMLRGKDDKTRLSYWFPLIENAGLPVPRTEIIRTELPLGNLAYGEPVEGFNEFVDVIRSAAMRMSLPCFLRTDFTSAKHYWQKTCCVTDAEKIHQHIFEIVEFSECADFIGLPSDVWIVREMLNTAPLFHAFGGDMPIVREFRFFVRDGTIEHVQPYWPAEAVEDGHPHDESWRGKLAFASAISDDEASLLSYLTIKASRAVSGFWSVDWLQTTDRGWVLTDMAEGEQSYRYGRNILAA